MTRFSVFRIIVSRTATKNVMEDSAAEHAEFKDDA